MKILSIPYNTNRYSKSFKSKNSLLEAGKNAIESKAGKTMSSAGIPIIKDQKTAAELIESLKELGIVHCSSKGNAINILTKDNGFFTIETDVIYGDDEAKKLVIDCLESKSDAFGGIKNYMRCVKDLKRQDIIQKGLKIHSYIMNCLPKYADMAKDAQKFTKLTGRPVISNDLFYVGDDAFYYSNIISRTVFSMSTGSKSPKNIDPIMSRCEFIVDSKGNAIGYKLHDWNVYKDGFVDTEYMEQQIPSVKLPSIVEPNNTKYMAEAFRFGNAVEPMTYRFSKGIPNVLEHLTNTVKIKYPLKKDLQLTCFYGKDNIPELRICYYDSSTGRSFVYNKEGKYMYQMEYIKNPDGEIISYAKY